jgi:hypothetical protein
MSVCHPEEPAFGSEGTERVARTFAHLLREYEDARLTRIHSKGGKSSAKFGQSRAIRAVYRAAGSVFHRLLVISS